MKKISCSTVLAALLLLAGCTTVPEPGPVVINEPVDALNAVAQPYRPYLRHQGRSTGDLSTDVERLKSAHRLYELSQERKLREVEHRQQLCREQEDSRMVKVEGSLEPLVYCEPAPAGQTGTEQ